VNRILALTLLPLWLLSTPALAQPEAEAEAAGPPDEAVELVRTTIDEVLGVLRQEDLPAEDRLRSVEKIAYARFDWDVISKLVLAWSWRKFTPEQRTEFAVQFRRHLSLSYGKTLLEYKDQEVRVTTARDERNGDVTVFSEIESEGANPYKLNYRLRQRGEEWLVIDVIVESVSLVQNFRSQAQDIVRQKGPEALIDLLKEKNDERSLEDA